MADAVITDAVISFNVRLMEEKLLTTELRCPPGGRLPSSVGTLSRELGQCAADAEVTCCVGAATHVLHAGPDVDFRVNQVGTGAPRP